jgi:hypothetical protein
VCIVSWRSLRRADHSSRRVLSSECVSVCDLEISTMRRPKARVRLKVTAYVRIPALCDNLAEKHIIKNLKWFVISAASYIYRSILLIMRNVSDKVAEKIKTHFTLSNFRFFLKILPFTR